MKHEPDWYNISLKVFLKNDKGEILALKAVANSTLAGFYDFPGGRINDDEFETDYETLIKRELEEEVGPDVLYKLSLKPVSFGRHHYFSKRQNKDIRTLWLFFEAEYLGGNIKISAEHTGLAWLDFSKIKLEDYFVTGPLEAVQRYLEFNHREG